jgi:hypothetical protein
MAESDARVPLAEMIETLRQELQVSLQRGTGQAIAFDIEKVELELKVAIARKDKGQAGVAFWVLTAGGGVERGTDTSHTFKLTLLPVDVATGTRARVAAESRTPLSDR